MKVKSLSHAQLLATPWTVAYQAPPSMGFSRQEYWSGLPLPSPNLVPRKKNFCFVFLVYYFCICGLCFIYKSHSVCVLLCYMPSFIKKSVINIHMKLNIFKNCIHLSECTVIDFSSSLVWCSFKNKAALSIHYYLFKLDFKKWNFTLKFWICLANCTCERLRNENCKDIKFPLP